MKSTALKTMAKLAKERLINKEENLSLGKNKLPSEDSELVKKIMTILKTHSDTPTPIQELIDYSKFNEFSPLQREIYLFDLIEKYNTYKQWYLKNQEQQHMVVL